MLTLVLGGARSGKSRFAQSLVEGRERVFFVATASVGDDPEMAARVLRHRAARPAHFETIESPLGVAAAIAAVPENATVLVDCVTLWLSNLLYRDRELDRDTRETRVLGEIEAFIETSRERDVVVVSNEVGGGIVPESMVAREFRDLQGRANQMLARSAGRVVLMVAGIPLPVK